MSAPPFLTSALLATPGVKHGFFSREGGVSKGAFASLNTGFGSGDDQDNVAENRARCAAILGVEFDRLLTANQTHSPDVIVVSGPWAGAPEKADGLVTATPGLAIGVLAADCMPWLLVDPEAKIIGAAHAGWRGALAGVLENTVAEMTRLGAKEGRIRTAVGPCLRQPNFEVGLDLADAFAAKYPGSQQFFERGDAREKRRLDLAGFGAWRLQECGVSQIDNIDQCTLAEPEKYFSYRAMKRAGGSKYGRNLSAIALG